MPHSPSCGEGWSRYRSLSIERVKHGNVVLLKSSHDERVKIIPRIDRQHRNKGYWESARSYEILELIGRECVFGAGPESNQSRRINGR